MEFLKIQVTKKNTLNIVFKDDAGNIVTVVGGNIVHKDLKACMNALIPHLSLLTEQREAENRTLKQLEADRIQDGNSRSVFKLMTVDTITLSDEETFVEISGQRICQSGYVIKVQSPKIAAAEHDHYKYCNDLFLAVEAVVCEANAYWNESKYGIKEGDLDFASQDPFDGKVTADQVPQADVQPIDNDGKKGKGKKRKSA
jgi:hypothetical protein